MVVDLSEVRVDQPHGERDRVLARVTADAAIPVCRDTGAAVRGASSRERVIQAIDENVRVQQRVRQQVLVFEGGVEMLVQPRISGLGVIEGDQHLLEQVFPLRPPLEDGAELVDEGKSERIP